MAAIDFLLPASPTIEFCVLLVHRFAEITIVLYNIRMRILLLQPINITHSNVPNEQMKERSNE